MDTVQVSTQVKSAHSINNNYKTIIMQMKSHTVAY